MKKVLMGLMLITSFGCAENFTSVEVGSCYINKESNDLFTNSKNLNVHRFLGKHDEDVYYIYGNSSGAIVNTYTDFRNLFTLKFYTKVKCPSFLLWSQSQEKLTNFCVNAKRLNFKHDTNACEQMGIE